MNIPSLAIGRYRTTHCECEHPSFIKVVSQFDITNITEMCMKCNKEKQPTEEVYYL